MSTKKTGCLWVFLGVALAISLLFNLIFAAAQVKSTSGVATSLTQTPRVEDRLTERVVESGSGDWRIAVIRINGLISSSVSGQIGDSMVDDIKIQLKQAAEDDKVRAIVLSIDSPGGEVTASDIIYNAVVRARAKKPVVISMGSMAASGGYYIACGGSWLIANETTFTGSIGVIIQTFRYDELLGKIGVAPMTFKSGEFKDMLSGTRAMTEPERAYVQGLVMETYGKFVGIVAKERKLDEQALRAGVADGRVITGKDALAQKLVNQNGEIEDAFAKAKELGNAPEATIISYESTFRLGRLFRLFSSESSAKKVEVNLTPQMLPALEPGKAYLLPSICVP